MEIQDTYNAGIINHPPRTYTVRIEYQDKGRRDPRVEILTEGDGGIDHWLDTFRAALVAAGFAVNTARRVVLMRPEGIDDE